MVPIVRSFSIVHKSLFYDAISIILNNVTTSCCFELMCTEFDMFALVLLATTYFPNFLVAVLCQHDIMQHCDQSVKWFKTSFLKLTRKKII